MKYLGAGVFVVVLGFVLGMASAVRAEQETPNNCGCYQDSTGSCYCGKQAKCGCPGSCEPKGCEEKREKALQKEIEAETKKALNGGAASKSTTTTNGNGVAAAAGSERDANDRAEREPARKRNAKPVRMTIGQRRELAKLLDLYFAEHGDRGSQSVQQLRGDLADPAE